MAASSLRRIRRLIEEGNYEITNYALDEAAEDDLHRVDIEAAILTGELTRIERGDRRGLRYVISGRSAGRDRQVGVVGRFRSRALFVIITVYEVVEK